MFSEMSLYSQCGRRIALLIEACGVLCEVRTEYDAGICLAFRLLMSFVYLLYYPSAQVRDEP
jgi:hypothetical protein